MSLGEGDYCVLNGNQPGRIGKVDGAKVAVALLGDTRTLWRTQKDVAPLFGSSGVPKAPLLGFIGVMGGFGALAAMGVVPANVAYYFVVPLMLIAVSIGELLGPDAVLDTYKMPVSPLVKSLLMNFDFAKVR